MRQCWHHPSHHHFFILFLEKEFFPHHASFSPIGWFSPVPRPKAEKRTRQTDNRTATTDRRHSTVLYRRPLLLERFRKKDFAIFHVKSGRGCCDLLRAPKSQAGRGRYPGRYPSPTSGKGRGPRMMSTSYLAYCSGTLELDALGKLKSE